MSEGPKYADLANLSEDQRIDIIGDNAMRLGLQVAFIVDSDAKADRYIEKLKSKWPNIHIVSRFKGPAKGMITVKVGPPANRN